MIACSFSYEPPQVAHTTADKETQLQTVQGFIRETDMRFGLENYVNIILKKENLINSTKY